MECGVEIERAGMICIMQAQKVATGERLLLDLNDADFFNQHLRDPLDIFIGKADAAHAFGLAD